MNELSQVVITPELISLIGAIDEFKGRWEALGNLAPERLSALRRIATIESVGSSTRIEGVKLTDDEVLRLLSGAAIRSFRSRDEQEVAGYAELMELIFDSYPEITLTENHIKQLHGILLKYSEKDVRHRGHYKTQSNNVEAFDEHGRSIGVIFETASPFDTPLMMEQLVSRTRASLETGRHHPLLVIAVFVVRFLAIHPFQDGNGRLSRALTTLLLLRCAYRYVPYSSLERVVEENKNAYYRSLRSAQATLNTNQSNLIDWLTFFIGCLAEQKETLERKVSQERLMAPLSPLSEKIMNLVREHGRTTVRDVVSVTGANRNTVKDHIKQLLKAGLLSHRGRGRGSYYEKP